MVTCPTGISSYTTSQMPNNYLSLRSFVRFGSDNSRTCHFRESNFKSSNFSHARWTQFESTPFEKKDKFTSWKVVLPNIRTCIVTCSSSNIMSHDFRTRMSRSLSYITVIHHSSNIEWVKTRAKLFPWLLCLQLLPMIVKCGDDLRQELLAYQLLLQFQVCMWLIDYNQMRSMWQPC